ncbi:MAG: hypothetical protein ACLFTX_06530 [Thiohalospira sp.]
MMYDDHYLEHYSDRYVSLGLREHGVTLEQYLAEPWSVEQDLEGLPRRNGAVVEPLRHHRHPGRQRADFRRRLKRRSASPVSLLYPCPGCAGQLAASRPEGAPLRQEVACPRCGMRHEYLADTEGRVAIVHGQGVFLVRESDGGEI